MVKRRVLIDGLFNEIEVDLDGVKSSFTVLREIKEKAKKEKQRKAKERERKETLPRDEKGHFLKR